MEKQKDTATKNRTDSIKPSEPNIKNTRMAGGLPGLPVFRKRD